MKKYKNINVDGIDMVEFEGEKNRHKLEVDNLGNNLIKVGNPYSTDAFGKLFTNIREAVKALEENLVDVVNFTDKTSQSPVMYKYLDDEVAKVRHKVFMEQFKDFISRPIISVIIQLGKDHKNMFMLKDQTFLYGKDVDCTISLDHTLMTFDTEELAWQFIHTFENENPEKCTQSFLLYNAEDPEKETIMTAGFSVINMWKE